MAQEAGAGVLIVGGEAEGRQQLFDGDDDGGGVFILVQAAVDIDNAVAAGLVGAGNDLPGAVQPEGGFHLIAVVAGVCSPQDGQEFPKAGEVPAGKLLLVSQFLLVAHGKQLAAAAAPGIGAGE